MSTKRKADVVIIGGGASGLAAAIKLGMSADLRVLVLEKMDEPGRKIRATGSGRCNITNESAAGYIDIIRFFTEIGLVTRSYDNGLVYPYSESASDVAELMTARAKELGTKFACGEEVVSVAEIRQGDDARFSVESEYKDENGEHTVVTDASYVILACGGKAGPVYGTTGDGYRFARSLGHSIVTPVPVLTGIECEEWAEQHRPCALDLAGTRTRGVVTLYRYGTEEIFEEEGEIQFTKYGLSGICVFNMTRQMRYDRDKGESLSDFLITADLYPGGDIAGFLRFRRQHAFHGEMAEDVLRSVLKKNIAGYVMRSVSALNIRIEDRKLSDLSDTDIEAISRSVHKMTFHPEKLRGWKDAQATAGGVSLAEIDEMTSESKLVSGLYITGELADRDYRCGGFNLSNAWLTGISAAEAISSKEK